VRISLRVAGDLEVEPVGVVARKPHGGHEHLEQDVAVAFDAELIEDFAQLLIELRVTGTWRPRTRRHSHHSSGSFASIERTLARVQVAQTWCIPRSSVTNDQPDGRSVSSSARVPHREQTGRSSPCVTSTDATAG
jgi:hypothetical protein